MKTIIAGPMTSPEKDVARSHVGSDLSPAVQKWLETRKCFCFGPPYFLVYCPEEGVYPCPEHRPDWWNHAKPPPFKIPDDSVYPYGGLNHEQHINQFGR